MNDLNIPSFTDFLVEIGNDRIIKWSDDAIKAVQLEIGISFDLTNPEDLQRFVTAMHALSQKTTMAMLQDYHEWLCRQLGKKSLRLI